MRIGTDYGNFTDILGTLVTHEVCDGRPEEKTDDVTRICVVD